MQNDKQQILATLKEEFNAWEALLAGRSAEQLTAPLLPSDLSIKDTVAHLMMWQKRSIARMEAGLHNREPDFPKWPEGLTPDQHDDTDALNAWMLATNRDRSWSSVYQDWRNGFLRFLELAAQVPAQDLLAPGKYSWLGGHPLSFILLASYEHHHQDHLEPLQAWLQLHGT